VRAGTRKIKKFEMKKKEDRTEVRVKVVGRLGEGDRKKASAIERRDKKGYKGQTWSLKKEEKWALEKYRTKPEK